MLLVHMNNDYQQSQILFHIHIVHVLRNLVDPVFPKTLLSWRWPSGKSFTPLRENCGFKPCQDENNRDEFFAKQDYIRRSRASRIVHVFTVKFSIYSYCSEHSLLGGHVCVKYMCTAQAKAQILVELGQTRNFLITPSDDYWVIRQRECGV